MTDVVVTVPKGLWTEWIDEGDLAPGIGTADWEGEYEHHFWIARPLPMISPGDRVYIVAHNRLRGYAPLHDAEPYCRMRRDRACLLRRGLASAITIPTPIRGFQGWRYRWWDRSAEVPFPSWRTEGVA
jgi:hypothetical protein